MQEYTPCKVKPRHDVTGERFNRLVVIKPVGKNRHRNIVWECLCDCGNITYATSKTLCVGATQSCGCLTSELTGNLKKTHGLSDKDEYKVWCAMKSRCNNKNTLSYERYGGRGINVCEEWSRSFEKFYEDMGDRPSKKHRIDRIDNSLGYSKNNCRWVTVAENNRNTRTNRNIDIDGETKTISEWSRHYGFHFSTIYRRVRKGMSFVDAIKFNPPH